MSNRQLIKYAHMWVLVVLVAGGLLAVGSQAEINFSGQNSNQNSNQNSSKSNATGEQAGMGTLNSHDHDFVMDAATGGMMEVELGRIAAQKATSDAVKQFGQRMVDDHSKANEELTTLASSKGITLPTTLDDKHRAQLTKFSSMSGAEFDRAYVKAMVSDHKKDVSEFEKQSTHATDADIKAFATKTLPTLQEHLKLINSIDSSMGGGNKSSNSNSNRP
jgi:putative membrane protein